MIPIVLQTRHRSSSKKSESVSSKTQEELFRLLNGDRTTAKRLVENLIKKNPDKSEKWCWEKVIYDLKRDRG